MIYVICEVVSTENVIREGKIFSGCWINTDDTIIANNRARKLIQSQGYDVVEILESYPIKSTDYEESTEGLEYFEQALIDSEVMVLFVSKENKHSRP